jgi:predicted MFS family arabinose efflux permease
MLKQLAAGLGVTIAKAGLLVTYGAVILCIGSPLVAWWTSRIDRRSLLAATLLTLAAGHAASALVTSYGVLLALRLAMLAVAAIFTPQAAGTVAMLVPADERPSAIAFVFLGWSLAVAAGLPLVTAGAAHFGWHAVYGALATAAAASAVLVFVTLPRGLHVAPVSLASWGRIAHDRAILRLLALTAVQVSGQFMVFTFLAPLLTRTAHAGTAAIGVFFAIFGVAGFVGNLAATRMVKAFNPYRTSWIFLLLVVCGLLCWTVGSGALVAMAIGVGLWGLGFAAINSMQQARLAQAAPDLAGASIALNTSCIYVGQAVGSALGGYLFARDRLSEIGYGAVAFLLAGLAILFSTRPRPARDGGAASVSRARQS